MARAFLFFLTVAMPMAQAASFTLGAVIQAGSASANELLAGSTSGTPSVTGSVTPYWSNAVNYGFSISYNATTNTATVQAQTGVGASSISWAVAGGAPGAAARDWTINTGGLQVIAADNDLTNTQVRIRNLTIAGPGFTTLSPVNLVANQNGNGTVVTGNAAPITFSTAAGAGNWVLSGQIRFVNLATAQPGGASGNQLRMAFDIGAVDQIPEPATWLSAALGLALIGIFRYFRPNYVT